MVAEVGTDDDSDMSPDWIATQSSENACMDPMWTSVTCHSLKLKEMKGQWTEQGKDTALKPLNRVAYRYRVLRI